ncbi:hypothetical protein SI65_05543 [Aspergillus cristatus]|uniref:Myb-like domain-containing protein n=1 Tax=Aspergillus cristatus TaxID=573508 RepID=A0A1E3BEW5_ASPCR|nr:hypothetical protein SI65_05543 [Aspergillus cristatus]
MAFHGQPVPGQGLEDFYQDLQAQWTGLDASPYVGANRPYCTTAFPATSILTPVSLPDSAFAPTRPSPVLSHHSQEYQHSLNDPAPAQHGLGIAAPFPGNYPRNISSAIGYPSEDVQYRPSDAALSPHPRPAKRARQSLKQPQPMRETPVSILPHPEGVQRLEQERRRGQVEARAHQRPRAPGRGRKDPQAEEEDAYVEGLRERNLAWKVIREMFRERFQKDASEARLQMRLLRRRKERLAPWDESDIQLLIRARDHWEHEKYQFIARKMQELGSRKSYTAEQCETQLRILNNEQQQREQRRNTPSTVTRQYMDLNMRKDELHRDIPRG